MDHPDFSFDRMNEADVREEVIAPLLRHLGYRSTTVANIEREVAVSYRLQLGREKKTDPDVRGRADYVCTTTSGLRLLVEAKPPHEAIDAVAVKQAWTYANHPDIAAALFMVTNGRQFSVFKSAAGPFGDAILSVSYEDMAGGNHALQNMLAPSAIDRLFPRPQIDFGRPLAEGLASSATIIGGSFTVHWAAPLPPMHITNRVVEGTIGREGDVLFISLRQVSPYPTVQAHAERIGTDRLLLLSNDSCLAAEAATPTRLFSFFQVSMAPTDVIPDLTNGGKPTSVAAEIHCDVSVRAQAWWDGSALRGVFQADMAFAESDAFLGAPPVLPLTGDFEIYLRP